MEKNISIYDISFTFDGNKIYLEEKTKIGDVPYMSYEDLEQFIIKSDVYDSLEIDKMYYMVVENPWEIYGIMSLRKGYTFLDCAEHDSRVIIKCAFPNEICHIIGE